MTDSDSLARLLRSAIPPIADSLPRRDLWTAVTGQSRVRDKWSWIDLGIAAAAALALTLLPGSLWLLAYHL